MDDDDLFADIERTAKGLSLTASTRRNEELRELIDGLRSAEKPNDVDAPSLAMMDLPAISPAAIYDEAIKVETYAEIIPWGAARSAS
ncbi:hypothetical protein ASG43_01810 [Aureimonas sp. Leaf454]|nr:hypothetical protein ASG43_01810 [Aureimonas sp. Leaf454]